MGEPCYQISGKLSGSVLVSFLVAFWQLSGSFLVGFPVAFWQLSASVCYLFSGLSSSPSVLLQGEYVI